MAQPIIPRVERRNLAMKAEAAYGVDVIAGAPAAGDYIEAYNIAGDPSVAQNDTPMMGGVLGSLGLVPGSKIARVSFEMMARGFGSAYSASNKPNVDLPLRACGMSATGSFGVGTEKWEYKPRNSGFESVTIYVLQENAPTVKLAGCFGDVGVAFRVGDMVRYRFTFTGIYLQESDTPPFAAKVFSATPQFPTLLSANFLYDGYAPDFASVSLGLNNALDVIEAANAASGIAGVYIGNRRPSGSIDPGAVTRAVYDWIAKWEQASQVAMSFQTNGAQYIRHKVTAPKVSIRQRGSQARGQKMVYGIALDLGFNAGEDELVLIFD